MEKKKNIQQDISITNDQNGKIIQGSGNVQNYPLPSEDTSKTKGIGKKVFISSTSFDLKDLRAELAKALKEWGYVPVWNESPDFPKKQGLHSHDVCLDVVKECDIYLLIIDKRYGGTYAGNKYLKEDISITWYETKVALQENKEIHTFIRDEVWNERPTYKKNLKEGVHIKLHHVDNPKVFEFIDFVVHYPRDNWIDTFKDSVKLKEKLKVILKELKVRKTTLPHLTNITPPESNFVGRTEEFETITKWYKNPDVHIGALIGWGGEGKSAIVRKWYDSLEVRGVKPDGIFWWGFYRNAYLDRFLDSLLVYLAQGRIDLHETKSTWVKVDKINELIQEAEYLIVLDGFEEMQKGEEHGTEFGCMAHRELAEILTNLADSKAKGLCLITTRYPLTNIKNWQWTTYQKQEVERLSINDSRALFEKIGVKGDQNDIDNVIEEYEGHALSLTLLAKYLVEDFKGDITKAKEIPPFHSDKEAGGKAHRILLWYEKQLTEAQRSFMKIFSLFRREVREKDFKGVFRSEMDAPMSKTFREMSEFSFKRMADNLCDRRLVTKGQDDTYTTHPLIKSYFESAFEEKYKTLYHKLIYQYIGLYAAEMPETLEEMQPLFEQIYHGCRAGLYDEVYNNVYQKKIQRWDKYFLTHTLGSWETDISLVMAFFPEGDLSTKPLVSKKREQSWLLNQAGLVFLSTGRPEEAKKLFIRKINMQIEDKDWKNASVGYQNLADLYYRSGELRAGLLSAKNALKMAEKADSNKYISYSKVYLGWILHLIGKSKEAGILFKDADKLSRKISGNRLHRLWGEIYADFLLSTKKVDNAFELTKQDFEICKKNNWLNNICRCHRLFGTLERIKEGYREADYHLQKATEISRKIGVPDLEIEALLERCRLDSDMGRNKNAIHNGTEVLTLCDRTGFKFYEPDTEVVLAKVYLALGDIDKATYFANSAYTKANEMQYNWPKVEAKELLEKISNRGKGSAPDKGQS